MLQCKHVHGPKWKDMKLKKDPNLLHELGEENMLVHERVGGDRQKKM